jgi:MFS family permease
MLGRKKTIFIGSIIMVIGAAIQCSSFSLGQLIASRFITGFGNGKINLPKHIPPTLTLVRYEYFDSTDMAI